MRRILVITVDEARALVTSAVRIAGERNIAVAAAFVGIDGGLLAFERAEDAISLYADAAIGKARTAVKVGGKTSQFTEWDDWDEAGIAGIAQLGGLTLAGGVCVVGPDGSLLGGLGVSGADEGNEDEAIAEEAAEDQHFQIEDEEPEPESTGELDRLDADEPVGAGVSASELAEAPATDPTSRDLRGGQGGLPAGGHAAAHRLFGDEPGGEQIDTDGGPSSAFTQGLLHTPLGGGGGALLGGDGLHRSPLIKDEGVPASDLRPPTRPIADGSATAAGMFGDEGQAVPATEVDDPDQRGGHAGEPGQTHQHD